MYKVLAKHVNKENFLLISLSYLLSAIGAYCFFDLPLLIFLPSIFFTFGLVPNFRQLSIKKKEQQARRALMNFLQYLCSSLAIGQPLRLVLQEMGNSNYLIGTADSSLQKKLLRISRMIQNQQSAAVYLPLLEEAFPCPETSALLYALSMEQQLGEKLLEMLRDSFDTARELVLLENEVAAANNRQRAESLILAILPFAMALFFVDIINTGEMVNGVGTLTFLLRSIAYALAMFAFILNLRFSTERGRRIKNEESTPKFIKIFTKQNIRQAVWLRWLIGKLPPSYRMENGRLYRLAFLQHFFVLDDKAADALLCQHVSTLLSLFVISLIIVIFLSLIVGFAVYWSLLLALSFAFLYEAKLRSEAKKNEESIRSSLPLTLSLLARLLRNGLHLRSALHECVRVLEKNASPLATILQAMSARVNYAELSSHLFEQLADNLKLSSMSSLLYVLARYSDLGSKELLNMFDKQLSLAWAEQRQEIRRGLDAKAGLTLVPMLLDLVAVMLIGLAPAMQIFMVF